MLSTFQVRSSHADTQLWSDRGDTCSTSATWLYRQQYIKQTRYIWGCFTNIFVIQSLCGPFSFNLQNTVFPKPYELGSWKVERMITPHHASHVTCHMSHIICFFVFLFCFLTKLWNLLVNGLLSTGPTQSSFTKDRWLTKSVNEWVTNVFVQQPWLHQVC